MLLLLNLMVVMVAVAGTESEDAAASQLDTFSKSVQGHTEILSESTGCPVQNSWAISTLNTNLLKNSFFMESADSLVNERLPERIFHTKGAAAFGYFEVTHNASDVTKAKFLDTNGKKTRVAVRFSSASLKKGASDLSYNARGYAAKFYTEEGNFDVPGVNMPVMLSREPLAIIGFAHASGPNPATNLADHNMLWDFITQNPDSFYGALMYPLSPRGLPLSYRYMPGYGLHTLQLANDGNETHFTRFYFIPDLGIQNMTTVTSTDVNYYARDLYNAIANETYPSWTVYIQPLTKKQVNNASGHGLDVFDVTKEISTNDYPLREVGRIVLNENPQNYFAQVEQLAFNPGNVVPGIVGAPDKLHEARSLIYRKAHIYRLGSNFNKIPVNQPIKKVYTLNRDGRQPNLENEGGAPIYYPNSFNGPRPVPDHQPEPVVIKEKRTTNFDQASAFYETLSETEKVNFAKYIASSLSEVTEDILIKAITLISEINTDFSDRVEEALSASA